MQDLTYETVKHIVWADDIEGKRAQAKEIVGSLWDYTKKRAGTLIDIDNATTELRIMEIVYRTTAEGAKKKLMEELRKL